MLELYLKKYLEGALGATKITVQGITPELVAEVADKTEGFRYCVCVWEDI